MRKAFFIFILLSASWTGCETAKKFTNAQAECSADPACLADVKKYAELGRTVAGSFNPVAGGVAATVLTYIGLGYFGLKRKKAQNG